MWGGIPLETVLHECQLCLWEAFLLFCLYSSMFRMREACVGTHRRMDEVCFSMFTLVCVCVGGGMRPDKWADHLFKPISSHPCSEIKIEHNWLNFIWFQKGQGSLLSLQSEEETINCGDLILQSRGTVLKETQGKLHQTANSCTVVFTVRWLSKQSSSSNYFTTSTVFYTQRQHKLKKGTIELECMR